VVSYQSSPSYGVVLSAQRHTGMSLPQDDYPLSPSGMSGVVHVLVRASVLDGARPSLSLPGVGTEEKPCMAT